MVTRRQFLVSAAGAAAAAVLSATRLDQTVQGAAGAIIADHNAVNQYQNIPQSYINQIKKMWINIPGESHSYAYRRGCELLQDRDSRFAVNVTEDGEPEAYTDQHLRISRATWGDVDNEEGWLYGYGEEDWYTSTTSVQRTKAHLAYCNTHNLTIAAMGFGWCWDMCWMNNPGGTVDPVYKVRWAGSSNGGPDGDQRWGLDAADFALTENHVCLDTYLDATQQYSDYCAAQSYPTRVFFTTGTVDLEEYIGENDYQRHLKNERIRTYVRGSANRILFDYADILCWNDAGQQNILNWSDYGGTLRAYPKIHDDNLKDLDGNYSDNGAHIGDSGTLRLGKAIWWLLARIAGWDGMTKHSYLPMVKR
jgi:hypothetical protein